MSACSCISNLLAVMPPSTPSTDRGMQLSWFIASRICKHHRNRHQISFSCRDKDRLPLPTSLVWKQTASSAAKAR